MGLRLWTERKYMQNKSFYVITLDEELFGQPWMKPAVMCRMGTQPKDAPRGDVYVDLMHPICSQAEALDRWRKEIGPVVFVSRFPLGKESWQRFIESGSEILYVGEMEKRVGQGTDNRTQQGDLSKLVPERPASRGKIEPASWVALLSSIHTHQMTGNLYLKTEKIKKMVTFLGGFPLQVKSNKSKELLGRMLVDENIIPASACEESVKKMNAESILQGQALVRMNLLTEDELVAALSRQWAIKLLDVFEWLEGEYVFKEEAIQVPEFLPPFSFCDLMSSGLSRLTSGIVEASVNIASGMFLVPHPVARWRYQPLPANIDMELFGRIDGRLTVSQLMESGQSDRTQMTILSSLLLSNALLLCLRPLPAPQHFGGFSLPGEHVLLPARMLEELEVEWQTGISDIGRIETWLRRIHSDRFLVEKSSIREQMESWFNKLSHEKMSPVQNAGDLRLFQLGWKVKYE